MNRIVKIGLVASIAMLMVYGIVNISMAADVSKAQVMMVGVNPGAGGAGSSAVKVSLKNISGTTVGTDWANGATRMFFLTTDLGDQGLATVLTAFSLGKPVWARIAGDAPVNSLISIIYLAQ